MLEPDRDQLEIFTEALFRHAGQGGVVSLRAFYEDDSVKPFRITATSLSGGLPFLIEAAEDDARRAANHPKRVVFCPPIATFNSNERAREIDIAEGLALSVECDQRPREAIATLEAILGPATVVVASGGKWTDPVSGQVYDKLHLHWRLRTPARGEALLKLKQARDLATRIAGGDPSNKPVCHPIRWPGSWHRKGEPRLCRIETANPDHEIDLAAALTALTAAAPAERKPNSGATGATTTGTAGDWQEVKNIVDGNNLHESIATMAMKLLRAGTTDGAAVNILRAAMNASNAARDDRWEARYYDIPRAVATAREKIEETPAPDAEQPSSSWRYHDEEPAAPTPWLIKNILPETGAGLLSGQWGTYKTTAALDISHSIMTGAPFAGRFAVRRPGAVIYLAPEGAGGLKSRLNAIANERGATGSLPFAWRSGCPALTALNALGTLTRLVEEAAKHLEDGFDVPTALIWIDTVIAAAGYSKPGDDNDQAVAQKLMSVLSGLSERTGALVIGVDHFGKVTETGTRGSSAKEGHADVVLALLAARELSGAVTNTRLAIRKVREGPSGLELPFTVRDVKIGLDEDGERETRKVIDWNEQAGTTPTDPGWPKPLQLLRRILMTMLADVAIDVVPFANGPTVRAIDKELIRAEFYKQYPADGDAEQKAQTRRKAFGRTIRQAQDRMLIMVREIDGVELVWLSKKEEATA